MPENQQQALPGDNKAKEDQKQPAQGGQPGPPPADHAEAPIPNDQRQPKEDNTSRSRNEERWISKHIVSLLIFGATTCYAFFSYWTLQEISKSNEIASQSAYANQMLTAQSQRIMRQAMDRTKEQSDASLSMAQNSLMLSERPWLSVWSIGDPGELTKDTPVTFDVVVHNSGHSSALNTINAATTTVILGPLTMRPNFDLPP